MTTKSPTLKVAVVQSTATPCAVADNLRRLDTMLEPLATEGVKLALLPEFFPTGNPLEERVLRTAIETQAQVEAWLRRRAAELGMVLTGSYVALDGAQAYNRFSVVAPDGAVAFRDKLCTPAPEALYYRASDHRSLVVDTGPGRIGLLMCIEMSEPELVLADFTDCALILIAFAIPGRFPIPRRIRDRLTTVPPALAQRNGVPVLLSSLGGTFRTHGSPVLPFGFSGDYVGQSGIHLPGETIAGPLAPGASGVLIADVPLGPGVCAPDPSAVVECGIPLRVRAFDALLLGRARRRYRRNLAQCLSPDDR